ncbi:hypothetical protein B0H13DRAFT_1664631 [Mycena leptocephala]|nr:hypothetical protein B0H13DRAFT_1664631 [Mycena leptocephala]
MVVAGDFAQLPPTTGPSLYSGDVSLQTTFRSALDQRKQNAVMGHILWHQFNTVVMLRQNMRQQAQTPANDKLRTTLENMRYGACTDNDIEFLESRIAGFRPENPKLSGRDVRNVSIITARKSQKYALDKLGAACFAKTTNQILHHFCSVDRISPRAVDKSKWKTCLQSDIKKISKSPQKLLWDAPPSSTNKFIPGTRSICMGMIMLRANAIELCITKGQEAVVCGWDESMGQRVLDTLFVRLVKPPGKIQIADMPKNVVPLVHTSTHLTILLSDDTLLSVVREQVVYLLNFGMTDYTSQGKSRPKNPVELAKCNDHRSYYIFSFKSYFWHGPKSHLYPHYWCLTSTVTGCYSIVN